MHRPVLPVDEVAGCPASCIFPPSPGCVSGLPRTPLPFCCAGVRILRLPLGFGLRLCRRWTFELPRTSHTFGVAGFGEVPGFPGGSRLLLQRPRCWTRISPRPHLRLYRRWVIESPRFSHLSAVPSCQSSSHPEPQPFGIADDSSPRSPRTSNPPAPTDGYPSCLGSRTFRFALVRSPSRPESPPLATTINQFPGCPKSRVFRRSPIHLAPSCPEPWFLG
jgi:hypothetical protein